MQKIELQHKINVACMLCKDLDQPGHPPGLSVLAVVMEIP